MKNVVMLVKIPTMERAVCLLTRIAQKIHEPLTLREAQVLSLWLLGNTMQQIGTRLFISSRTVESHMNHVRDKIQLKAREDILHYLILIGLYDDFVFLAKKLLVKQRA